MICDYSGCHREARECEIVTSDGHVLHAEICDTHYDLIDKQSHNIFRIGGSHANCERRSEQEITESRRPS